MDVEKKQPSLHVDTDTESVTDSEPHTPDHDVESQQPKLELVKSHVSTADTFDANAAHHEAGDEIYDKFSRKRKIVIVLVLSFCSFLAPISSTSILSASPEVVETYHTTGTIFDVSNALYLVFMGLSPLLYGPLGSVYGRKWPLVVAAVTFTGFSAGTAFAPNLASYFVFRCLTAFQGTCFLIVGGTAIGDMYKPIERSTWYALFLTGTLIGPCLGPLITGIMVTYVNWRYTFVLQTALAGVATIAILFLVPETIHRARKEDLKDVKGLAKAKKVWSWTNPWRVLVLYRYPNLLTVGLASSALVWNMYSLLTPIRYILNPRFDLSAPWQSGLFYIAPGAGYLVGSLLGGRWADRTVKKWIVRRGGKRIPEDRLHSCLTATGIVIPGSMLVYGWCLDQEVGGIAVPVIAMFVQGVAQLFCFPSLNTYCLDVMQKRSAETVAGNYLVRYFFAAAGSAACLPLIEAIGVGWFSTISAAFLVVSAGAVWATAKWGSQWREAVDERWPLDDR